MSIDINYNQASPSQKNDIIDKLKHFMIFHINDTALFFLAPKTTGWSNFPLYKKHLTQYKTMLIKELDVLVNKIRSTVKYLFMKASGKYVINLAKKDLFSFGNPTYDIQKLFGAMPAFDIKRILIGGHGGISFDHKGEVDYQENNSNALAGVSLLTLRTFLEYLNRFNPEAVFMQSCFIGGMVPFLSNTIKSYNLIVSGATDSTTLVSRGDYKLCDLCNNNHHTETCFTTLFDPVKKLKEAVVKAGLFVKVSFVKEFYQDLKKFTQEYKQLEEKLKTYLSGADLESMKDDQRENRIARLNTETEILKIQTEMLDKKTEFYRSHESMLYEESNFLSNIPIEINDNPMGTLGLYFSHELIALTIQDYAAQARKAAPGVITFFDSGIQGEKIPERIVIKPTYFGMSSLDCFPLYPKFLFGSSQRDRVIFDIPHISVELTDDEYPRGGLFTFINDSLFNECERLSTQTINIATLIGYADTEHKELRSYVNARTQLITLSDVCITIKPVQKSESNSSYFERIKSLLKKSVNTIKKTKQEFYNFSMSFKTDDGKSWHITRDITSDRNGIDSLDIEELHASEPR